MRNREFRVRLLCLCLLLSLILTACNSFAPSEQGTDGSFATESPTQLPESSADGELRDTAADTEAPTDKATESPTEENTEKPTEQPTENPTDRPTEQPTEEPSGEPTEKPTDSVDGTTVKLPEEAPKPDSDPYASVDVSRFYENYKPAESYWDSYYRTLHGLMSGEIGEQDQEPTVAEDRPMSDGRFVRNTSALYSEDGNAYYIVNAEGEIVNRVYRGGAYIMLEEVAAYVFAFGDVPANYDANKKAKPYSSIWGEYLRVNHTSFSGSTSKYPYEPELPDISGCGGSLKYYEIDIGTTGTDCDPQYTPAVYNNGSKIVRGAARIVYARFDANGDKIIDVNERYLFYTYNHYNDFQEYLNYEGGWGEMFGNITGGGTISSKTHYNPTPYVETARADFVDMSRVEYVCVIFVDTAFIEKRYSTV